MNLRHDKVKDFFHDKAALVFNDVEKEARLKPVEEQCLNPGANVSEGTRSDARVNSFAKQFQNTHFDIKVINAQANTHVQFDPRHALKNAELGKVRAYKERIENVENGTFIPLVFTSKGAKSRRSTSAIAKLVTKIATKEHKRKRTWRGRYQQSCLTYS